MENTYNKQEIALILRDKPELFRLMKLITDEPAEKREQLIEKALELIKELPAQPGTDTEPLQRNFKGV